MNFAVVINIGNGKQFIIMKRQTSLTVLSLIAGLGLVFIGSRFLLAPETAEQGFGIRFTESGDYAFHTIKGIRDLFTGLLIVVMASTAQRKALGLILLLGALIPVTDGLIVFGRPEATTAALLTHWVTAGFCAVIGALLLIQKTNHKPGSPQPDWTQPDRPRPGYVNILESAGTDGASVSVLEMSISPGTGTPAHAHHQFAETFTVLAGELSVTVNGQTHLLHAGESATVDPGMTHGFQNTTTDMCHIRVRIEPGNVNFESAMLIYYGLMRDGRANRSGTPKHPGDLALFLHLSDSNLVGAARIVQPVFSWLARWGTRNGRLAELRNRYVSPKPTVRKSPTGVMTKLMVAGLLLTSAGSFAQKRFSRNEISINGFRAPSIGLEFRHRAVSIHAGYYVTNFTPNTTTQFLKTGLTGYFLPVGRRENPSSFYASVSYLRGLNRDYENQNAGSVEAGFRWMVWRGLNLRIGAIALAADGKDLKINPTPGISYSFFFN